MSSLTEADALEEAEDNLRERLQETLL